jgi:sugar-specific transcriptional regulator TrmB
MHANKKNAEAIILKIKKTIIKCILKGFFAVIEKDINITSNNVTISAKKNNIKKSCVPTINDKINPNIIKKKINSKFFCLFTK